MNPDPIIFHAAFGIPFLIWFLIVLAREVAIALTWRK